MFALVSEQEICGDKSRLAELNMQMFPDQRPVLEDHRPASFLTFPALPTAEYLVQVLPGQQAGSWPWSIGHQGVN